jgi:hypothetical protein
MKRYSLEELSRILTAQAGDLLRRGGIDWVGCASSGRGCASQFAYNEPDVGTAFRRNMVLTTRFDNDYYWGMSAEHLLLLLEE